MEISIITFIGEARAVAVPASDAGLKTLPLDGELVRWGSGPRSEPVLQIGDQDPFAVSCALGTFAETGDRSLVLRPVAGSPILVEFVDSKAVSKKEEVMAWLQSCALGQSLSVFDTRTEATSADSYFRYYGMLLHQQNMLQDTCRTGTYYSAILQNVSDFYGKVVVDVGAGTGILSLFACQAGAKKVYAIEASDMAAYAKQLAEGNPMLGQRVEIIHGKIEDVDLPEKADILISEPMGTLLVNERMLETYVHARTKFLKPGGKMFPGTGRIHFCAFRDDVLHYELLQKGQFWSSTSFYGVNLSVLHQEATKACFGQCVVDAFSPSIILSDTDSLELNFHTIEASELEEIKIPVSLKSYATGPCHGVAFWFDVTFPGASQAVVLSTAPGLPTTHWYQLRCVFQRPVMVEAGKVVEGTIELKAHRRQSYDVHVSLKGVDNIVSSGVFDLKEPFYRQMTPQGWLGTTDTGAIVKAQQITTEDPAHLRTSDQAMLGRESDMGNEAGSLQHVENSDGKRMTL